MMTKEEFDYYLKIGEEPRNKDKEIERVPLNCKEFVDCNILEVKVGTTGYMGGDTGHGGRTRLVLKNISSTDMRVSLNNGEYKDVDELSIVFGGDSELDTFTKALIFATNILMERTMPKPWYKMITFKLKMLWWKLVR